MKPSGDVQVHFKLWPHKVTRQGLATTVEMSHSAQAALLPYSQPLLWKHTHFFFLLTERERRSIKPIQKSTHANVAHHSCLHISLAALSRSHGDSHAPEDALYNTITLSVFIAERDIFQSGAAKLLHPVPVDNRSTACHQGRMPRCVSFSK